VLQHRATLDRQILRIVRADPVCRLLMTAPGVGALVSLAFKVAVDDPQRFSRSRDVGANFGSTPREYSSGEMSYHGRISKMATARSGGCSMSRPAAYCGATRRCGVRSKSGPCGSHSVSGSAEPGWRWHANSRSCCTPCGATGRYSSGGVLRHRHQPKPRRHHPDFFRAHAVPSGTAVRSPVREGRGGTRARLPAWCARLSVRRRL
jgi:transposase